MGRGLHFKKKPRFERGCEKQKKHYENDVNSFKDLP